MNESVNKKKRRGGVVILISLLMIPLLLSVIALAVDLTHLYSVHKQMQNAADAAALYGAENFTPTTPSGSPNFSQAQTKALAYLQKNKVDGVTLTTATVLTGYWDLTQAIPGVRAVNPPDVIGSNDVAAIQVTITKSEGVNGGPLKFYFAPIFGVNTTDVTVNAVAVAGSPTGVPENGIFPLAITLAAVNSLWDPTTNEPIGGETPTTVTYDQSSLGWTSFDTNVNDVPTITNLITNGNPVPYSIGDQIWIQSGVKASIYNAVPINVDVLVAIVNDSSTTGVQPILGFASFHILSTNQGSKTITGHLNPDYEINTGGIQGLNYGVYAAPRLVK